MGRLSGKTIVITGGNSGVGAAAAIIFAKEGANIVISARRKPQLDEVANTITSAGGKALAVPTDISKNEDCEALMKATIEKFGSIDVLVNNAGVLDTGLKSIDKYLDEDVQKVVNINQIGTMQCIRAALKYMKEGGSIINVASVAGVTGGGGAVYASTKAAIIGLTKHTAMVLSSKFIRCNVVCPGNILTPMTSSIDPKQLDMETMKAINKHGDVQLKSCTPEDVARVLLFLASDDSKPITGQVLVTDYGVFL